MKLMAKCQVGFIVGMVSVLAVQNSYAQIGKNRAKPQVRLGLVSSSRAKGAVKVIKSNSDHGLAKQDPYLGFKPETDPAKRAQVSNYAWESRNPNDHILEGASKAISEASRIPVVPVRP